MLGLGLNSVKVDTIFDPGAISNLELWFDNRIDMISYANDTLSSFNTDVANHKIVKETHGLQIGTPLRFDRVVNTQVGGNALNVAALAAPDGVYYVSETNFDENEFQLTETPDGGATGDIIFSGTSDEGIQCIVQNKISAWKDRTGNTWNTITGYPTIDITRPHINFNADQGIGGSSITLDSSGGAALAWVCSMDAWNVANLTMTASSSQNFFKTSGTGGKLWSIKIAGTSKTVTMSSSALTNGQAYVFIFNFRVADGNTYLTSYTNGVQGEDQDYGSVDIDFVLDEIGFKSTGLAQGMNGKFYELLAYNKRLTDTEIIDLNAYLMAKHGL